MTDSGSEITASDDKPALRNLLAIYSGVTGQSVDDIVNAYQGKGYGDFKAGLTEAVNEFLAPIQAKYHELMADEAKLLEVLRAGADRARPVADATFADVKAKLGLVS